MPAAKQNLTLYQGETFRFRFRYKNPDGTPVNLTGCSARMQVRPDVDSSTIYLDLTDGNNKLIIDGVNGIIDVLLPATDVEYADIAWEEGVYDIEVQFPDVNSTVDKIAYGKVKVIREVTR